jgi:hypothetical protein
MANGEDRPIIVSGGDEMYTITLPPATTDQGDGSFTVRAQEGFGPFKMIELSNTETKEVAFRRPATGNWTIKIC